MKLFSIFLTILSAGGALAISGCSKRVGETEAVQTGDSEIQSEDDRVAKALLSSNDRQELQGATTGKNEMAADRIVLKPNQTITTAEQYLYAFEHQPHQFSLYKYSLSEEEYEKVVRAMRKRFPFQSLRDRLAYENPGPIRSDSPAPRMNIRKLSLMKLHSDEVKSFIARPMNGLSRMIRPSPEFLRFPEVESQSPDRFTFNPGKPSTHGKVILGLHLDFAQNFADSQSATAYVKSIDEVAGFQPHSISLNLEAMTSPSSLVLRNVNPEERKAILSGKSKSDVAWKMKTFQLVSLLKHDEPRVYLSENVPAMEELSAPDYKTRKLNEFEQEALRKLLSGEKVVVYESTHRIQMLGAIRAQSQCLDCHSTSEGKLLGAFSYQFDIVDRIQAQQQRPPGSDQTGT